MPYDPESLPKSVVWSHLSGTVVRPRIASLTSTFPSLDGLGPEAGRGLVRGRSQKRVRSRAIVPVVCLEHRDRRRLGPPDSEP